MPFLPPTACATMPLEGDRSHAAAKAGRRGASQRPMRILSRYILKEVANYAAIGLLVFSFVIYVRPLSQLLELVVQHNLSGSNLFILFLLPLPAILMLTIPIAVLVGTLMGLGRMAADGETIALRAVGLGSGPTFRPVLIFALAAWLLASGMSLFLSPAAERQLARMQARLGAAEAAYQVQPRVFIERFPHLLLYVQNITGSRPEWHDVFIADTKHPNSIRVTLAKTGWVVNQGLSGPLTLRLNHGATHEYDPSHPDAYTIVSFAHSDIPVQARTSPPSIQKSPAMLTLAELWRRLHVPAERHAALVELNYRLALPFATLVLPLVGIPLGLMTRRGGKSFGLILTILLVFAYYILMASGLSLAKQGRLDPTLSLWAANLLFAVWGSILLLRFNRVPSRSQRFKEKLEIIRAWFGKKFASRLLARQRSSTRSARERGLAFPQILDIYVLKTWLFYFALLLVAFSGIYMVFDFFQLLGDIVRHHDKLFVVLDYYRFLTPEVVYRMMPLGILTATLITLGLMTKWNETTALRSVGTSLFRLAAPILTLCALLSGAMFLLANDYLPYTNQRQDALRNIIKGKPPQTAYSPGRQWISGQRRRIYYYRYFDSERNVFGHLTVFEFSRHGFQLTRRIYANRAFWEPHAENWVLEDGWVRDIAGDRVTNYRPFTVATFRELSERPSYFKTEVKPSEQMSALELWRYIRELRQSGFSVVQLSVAFYRKFAYPLIALIVAMIGIPFAYSTGKRGALSGIAISIGIAILYWSVSSLFVAMGNLNQLPPAMAAWSPDVIFGLGGTFLFLRVRT